MLPLDELIEKSQALNKEKKYSEVIDLLTDEVLENYQSDDLYAEKAEAYYRLDKMDLCSKCVGKALLIDEFHAKAINYSGNLNQKFKQYHKAIAAYRKAINADPQYVNPYNGLGNAYKNLQEYDKAIEYYNKAIQIDPNFAFPYNGLASIYKIKKEYNKAIEVYDNAIKNIPTYINLYNGLGNLYRNLMELDKAIDTYNRAIKIDPSYASLYNGLGITYYLKNEYNDAIKTYSKAIEVNPEISAPYYNRASVYNYLKKFSKALKDYEKYIELNKGIKSYYILVAKSEVVELKNIIKSTEYNNIYALVEAIKKLLLFQDDCVTHYTSLSVAKILILEKSNFRLSEGAFLNDTSEGQELFKFLPELRKKNAPRNETIALPFAQKPFIGSFVSEIKHDDLTLWRMYGKENKDEARGCAITFNRRKLLENIKEILINDGKTEITEKMDEEFSFYRVAYRKEGNEELFLIPGATPEEQNSLNSFMQDLAFKVKNFLSRRRRSSDIQNLLELLNSIAYLFKSVEYQYEHELRLVVQGIGFKKVINTDSSFPRVFIELVPICSIISKITLGPKVERAEEWAAAFYYNMDKQDYHPEILISHLPFK